MKPLPRSLRALLPLVAAVAAAATVALTPGAALASGPGLLVGDMAQPRGGPMITGHASHQIGIDADIWLTPMPDHRMSRAEREETSATDMVRPA